MKKFYKKLFILGFLIFTGSSAFAGTVWFDLGNFSINSYFKQNSASSAKNSVTLSGQLFEFDFTESMTGLYFSYNPLFLSVPVTNSKNSSKTDWDDAASMFSFGNFEAGWQQLLGSSFMLNVFGRVNTINLFDIKRLDCYAGAELAWTPGASLFKNEGFSFLPKIFSIEGGAYFSSLNNYDPQIYCTFNLNLGIFLLLYQLIKN